MSLGQCIVKRFQKMGVGHAVGINDHQSVERFPGLSQFLHGPGHGGALSPRPVKPFQAQGATCSCDLGGGIGTPVGNDHDPDQGCRILQVGKAPQRRRQPIFFIVCGD